MTDYVIVTGHLLWSIQIITSAFEDNALALPN